MRTAQSSQAFTYITIIIIIGVIAVVGTKAIMNLLDANCESKSTEFSNKLSGFIEDYSDKGSVKTESIALPCDVKEICFINGSSLGVSTWVDLLDPVILSSVQDGTYNVFVRGEFTVPVLKEPKVLVDSGFLCLNVSTPHVKLRFSGQGRHTLISKG